MINFDLIKKQKHRNINQILDYVLIFLPQKSKVLNLYLRTSCHALVVHLSIGLELFSFLDSDCFLSPDFHPRSCVQLSSLLCSPGERGLSEMITFESLLFHPQLVHNILCWEGGQLLDQALVQWVQNHGLCHPVFLDCSEKYVVIYCPQSFSGGGLYLKVNWLLWSVYGGLLWSVKNGLLWYMGHTSMCQFHTRSSPTFGGKWLL